MRRAAAVIGVTVIGLWLVLTFKSSPPARVAIAGAATTGTTAPAGAGGPAAAGPPGSDTTTTQAGATRTVNGNVESNRYGNVQVAVLLNGTQIVDVKALQMPFDRSRSQEISSQAAPLLHDEVIQAQSAQIDTIGGATYTSDGYAQSLQSALDKAHA